MTLVLKNAIIILLNKIKYANGVSSHTLYKNPIYIPLLIDIKTTIVHIITTIEIIRQYYSCFSKQNTQVYVTLPPVGVAEVRVPHCCTASHTAFPPFIQTQKSVFGLFLVVLLGDDNLD